MNAGALALLIVVLGSGCATAGRASSIQVIAPPVGDQADVSGSASPSAQPAAAKHLSGMAVPNWWQTGALQSGDVMGTM